MTDSSRAPDSMAKGGDNPRDGDKREKGTRREAYVTNRGDRTCDTGNHQFQEEEYEGGDAYLGIFGVHPMGVRYPGNGVGPPIDLNWGDGKLWG